MVPKCLSLGSLLLLFQEKESTLLSSYLIYTFGKYNLKYQIPISLNDTKKLTCLIACLYYSTNMTVIRFSILLINCLMLFAYWKKIIIGIKWIVQLLKLYLRTISSFRVYLLHHFDIWKDFLVQLKTSLSSCNKNKCIIMHIILTFIFEWYDYYNNQEQGRIYSCYNDPCFPRTII